MLAGVERRTATEFSFFLAMPIMLAAAGYELTHRDDGADRVRDEPCRQTLEISSRLVALHAGCVVVVYDPLDTRQFAEPRKRAQNASEGVDNGLGPERF